MKPEDIKIPGKYKINFEAVLNYYITMYKGQIREKFSNYLIRQGPQGVAVLDGKEDSNLRSPSHWFSLTPDCGGQVWIHADWVIGPVEESKSKSSSINCDCANPIIVEAFAGIAAAGKTYKFCRCCKRERI